MRTHELTTEEACEFLARHLAADPTNRAVYKYPIPVADNFVIDMPQGAEILSAAEQSGSLFVWALVMPSAVLECRRFRLAGTGHPIFPHERLKFVATYFMANGLVFHLFESV